MTLTDLARKFCEQNGICWHEHRTKRKLPYWVCSCGKENCGQANPDLLDARNVLDVCKGWEDWIPFCRSIGYVCGVIGPSRTGFRNAPQRCLIYLDLITDRTEGRMLRAAVEWRREHLL